MECADLAQHGAHGAGGFGAHFRLAAGLLSRRPLQARGNVLSGRGPSRRLRCIRLIERRALLHRPVAKPLAEQADCHLAQRRVDVFRDMRRAEMNPRELGLRQRPTTHVVQRAGFVVSCSTST